MSKLPPPTAFGAPAKFGSWRPYQEESVLKVIENNKSRFIVQVQPTGSGKSLCYIMGSLLIGKRVLILTSTKALQDQIMMDFGDAFKIVDVRGQSGYICLDDVNGNTTVEDGACHNGYSCRLKESGCLYYDAIRKAKNAKIVVSNYAFWLTSAKYGDTIGKFDLLVLDEAHDAPEWVMKALSASINEHDIQKDLTITLPHTENVVEWKTWADTNVREVDKELEKIKAQVFSVTNAAKRIRLKRYERALDNILAISTNNMVVDRTTINGYTLIEPITAIGLAEKLLFRGIEKILLTSATIRPKTMWMMGLGQDAIKAGEVVIEEYPSQFDLARRPVIYIPTIRVQHDMDVDSIKRWIAQIDNVIRGRQDRKGIIHSVSYSRMKKIIEMSEFSDIMFGHDRRTINHTIKDFRDASPPAILVSPSISTGYDFPLDSCEYQIISKIAFPDSRSSSMKARVKHDKDYAYYITMQQVVQASGRGMRSAEDQCEVLILDDHWQWFISRYRNFAPKWFLDACRSSSTIPKPPKRLGG